MNLSIQSIADAGNLQKERLILRASTSLQLGQYALFKSYVRDGGITTYVPELHWFADKAISAGDRVVLYSRAGNPSQKVAESGGIIHFVYWGQKVAMWDDKEYAPVVVHIPDWQSFIPA